LIITRKFQKYNVWVLEFGISYLKIRSYKLQKRKKCGE